ncbi:MAG: molybdenum cofactor guanylyltransferase [Sandaracinaceae bacterium]
MPLTALQWGGVGGVFVGGASRRMGRDKGLLSAPGGGTLVGRAAELLGGYVDDVVLVGERDAYRGLSWCSLRDDPPGVGPVGGLNALLTFAAGRPALVLACDMPFVTSMDIEVLLAASGPDGRTVVPRRDGRWEPFCAVYGGDAAARVAPLVREGERRMQRLIDALGPLTVDLPAAHLRDWDTPEDVG